MPEMKGITVKIPADLHAEVKAYFVNLHLFFTCISAADSAAVWGGGSMAAFLLYREKRGNTITHFDP